jgi:hypothetical protein
LLNVKQTSFVDRNIKNLRNVSEHAFGRETIFQSGEGCLMSG